jgi:hypothetical protein
VSNTGSSRADTSGTPFAFLQANEEGT